MVRDRTDPFLTWRLLRTTFRLGTFSVQARGLHRRQQRAEGTHGWRDPAARGPVCKRRARAAILLGQLRRFGELTEALPRLGLG